MKTRIRNIVLVRLVGNEEIMGELIEENEETITVKNPMLVDEAEGHGQGYIVLINYVPFVENPLVKLKQQHIVNYHHVHPYVRDFYDISMLYSDRIERLKLEDLRKTNELMMERLHEELEDDYDETNPFFHKSTNTLN